MKKKFIVKKDTEITAILKLKRSIGSSFFVLYYTSNYLQNNFRFALSIGRKYGKAFERNLIKRRLRMVIYNHYVMIDHNISFVLVVKPKAKILNFKQIEKELSTLLKKIY